MKKTNSPRHRLCPSRNSTMAVQPPQIFVVSYREHGISTATLYNWKAKYGGLEASQLKRIKELEEENNKLKRMYADVSIQRDALKDRRISLKKTLTPDEKRQAVAYLRERRVSLRQACLLINLSSSVYYYKHKIDPDDAPLQDKLTRLAEEHRRWGFWKMFHYLRGQAMPWNHKRVYRVYTQLNLNIRRKPKKRLPSRIKEPLYQPELPNSVWSMDFMFDRLTNGRSFRTLNILDDFNREVVNIVVDTSISNYSCHL